MRPGPATTHDQHATKATRTSTTRPPHMHCQTAAVGTHGTSTHSFVDYHKWQAARPPPVKARKHSSTSLSVIFFRSLSKPSIHVPRFSPSLHPSLSPFINVKGMSLPPKHTRANARFSRERSEASFSASLTLSKSLSNSHLLSHLTLPPSNPHPHSHTHKIVPHFSLTGTCMCECICTHTKYALETH
jgi:hypothetical protein